MANTRYLVVTMERDTPKLPVHALLANYHWTRLDDHTVLTLANYGVSSHRELQAHPAVSILPHSVSAKQLKSQIRPEHFESLQRTMKLGDLATMGHLLDGVEDRMGLLMHPYK